MIRGGGHGFIVPKSFLYIGSWKTLREKLLGGLNIVADCGRAWDDVLLEQVIYIHRKGKPSQHYHNYKRVEKSFEPVARVDKRQYKQFEVLVNGVTDTEIQIASRMRSSGECLGDYTVSRRGASIQKHLSNQKEGYPCLGGTNIQRYHLRGVKGYFESDAIPKDAAISIGNILVQRIVAHIDNPMPHIKITGHIVQGTEAALLIANTVTNIEVDTAVLSPYFVLGLLHSKLINWYVYRFIYTKAVRSSDFVHSSISRIPLPNLTRKQHLLPPIIAQVQNIYANPQANQQPSQARIDSLIFQLYDLSPQQIALVQAHMP